MILQSNKNTIIEEEAIEQERQMTDAILSNTSSFEILSDDTIVRLKNVGSGKYLDLAGDNVIQYTSNTASKTQQFRLLYNESLQSYKIASMNTNNGYSRTVAALMGRVSLGYVSGVEEIIYWNIYQIDNGKYKILNNYDQNEALTTVGTANGTSTGTSMTSAGNAITLPYEATNNQQWEIEILETTKPFQGNAVYKIKNVASGKYMDVAGGDAQNANIIQYTKNSGENQSFRLDYDKYKGSYTIRPKDSNNGYNRMVSRNGSTQNLHLNQVSYPNDQEWKFMSVGNGRYKIVLRSNTNTAMTAYGTANGSTSGTGTTSAGNMFASTYTGSTSQQWIIEKVAEPDKIPLPNSKAAVFVGKNIADINTQNDLKAEFTSFDFNYYRNLNELNVSFYVNYNNTKKFVFLWGNLYKGELNLGGEKTVVVNPNTVTDNFEVRSWKIEKKASSSFLMNPYKYLENKTVVNVSVLDKTTNNIYFIQQEVNCNFDEIHAFAQVLPKENNATTMMEDESLSEDAKIQMATEVEELNKLEMSYITLGKATPIQAGLDEAPSASSAPFSDMQEGNKGISIDVNDMDGTSTINSNVDAEVSPRAATLINNIDDSEFKITLNSNLRTKYSFNETTTGRASYAYALMNTPVPGRYTVVTPVIYFETLFYNAHTTDQHGRVGLLQIKINYNGYVIYDVGKNKLFKNELQPAFEVKEANCYFQSRDTNGVFNTQQYKSEKKGLFFQIGLQKVIVGLASAVNPGAGILIDYLVTEPSNGAKENYEYSYGVDRDAQRRNNIDKRVLYRVEGQWKTGLFKQNGFKYVGDNWEIKARRNNMSSYTVGYYILSQLDTFVYQTMIM